MARASQQQSAPRVNKRLALGAQSREEILDAASRMMSKRGFAGTSVADIARESGLPNSSIYWHFQSKAGILTAVMERGAQRFFDDVTPTPPTEDESPREHLQRAFTRIGSVFREHPEFLRLFVLLLLGNESEDTTTIVEQVRLRGRESLQSQLRASLTPWGDSTAQEISESLVDFAMAGFDGAFIGFQIGEDGLHERLMQQLADSLFGLAEIERAALSGRAVREETEG